MVRICIPVCVKTAAELAEGYARALELADVVEIRLDCLAEDELAPALDELAVLLEKRPRPVFLTRRLAAQGGQSDFNPLHDSAFWQIVVTELQADGVDIELELLYDGDTPRPLTCFKHPVLASHHDFSGTPDNLAEIYERLARTGADALKIAVMPHDLTDCLPIFKLLARARREGRRLIALSMGEAGLITRILGPAHGSFMTFAALDEAHATAPGQIRADILRQLYRIDQITRRTPVYGVIGWPVGHSRSPQLHNKALADSDLEGVYLPLAVNNLDDFMRRMVRPETREMDWDLRGFSVTAPHKQAIMPHLNDIDPTAQAIGAVNTVMLREGKLYGYNTDAEGFIVPLREAYGDVRGARCAVLGAGGAARCAVWALQQEGAQVTVLARNPQQAAQLAQDSGSLADAALHRYDIVINATPLGTHGAREDETPVTAAQLHGVALAYDLVYNPARTLFLQEAEAAGCATLGGWQMLERQAAAQFQLWMGKGIKEKG